MTIYQPPSHQLTNRIREQARPHNCEQGLWALYLSMFLGPVLIYPLFPLPSLRFFMALH